jgi:hypothetical protein
MKSKIAYLLTLCFLGVTLSCSSDDDGGGGPTGPTISTQVFATWNLGIIIENNQTSDTFPCEEDIEYKFNNNGTYTKLEFSTDANDNCVVATTINGNWQAVADNEVLLTPLSASFSQETLVLSILNNGNQLQVVRTQNLTELYNKQ